MASDNEVDIRVHARYSHGQPVQGNVVVVCGTETQIQTGTVSFISLYPHNKITNKKMICYKHTKNNDDFEFCKNTSFLKLNSKKQKIQC